MIREEKRTYNTSPPQAFSYFPNILDSGSGPAAGPPAWPPQQIYMPSCGISLGRLKPVLPCPKWQPFTTCSYLHFTLHELKLNTEVHFFSHTGHVANDYQSGQCKQVSFTSAEKLPLDSVDLQHQVLAKTCIQHHYRDLYTYKHTSITSF